jgi:hypothetical protein
MWLSVGAGPTAPISNRSPDVKDLEAGSMGEELSAPPEPGYLWPATATLVVALGTKDNIPSQQAVIEHG